MKAMKVVQRIDFGVKMGAAIVLGLVATACTVVGGITMTMAQSTAKAACAISKNLNNPCGKKTES